MYFHIANELFSLAKSIILDLLNNSGADCPICDGDFVTL